MTDWLAEWPARMAPLADLLCFPGAGAGPTAFRDWPRRLPGYTAVLACHLPGRERRLAEPFAPDLAQAAAATVSAYARRRPAPRPVVLFGHSMGGALAIEAAARLAACGRPASALVLAASAPPEGRAAALLDAEALARLLVRYDPANAELTAEAELFGTLAPVLAADVAMLRRHRPAAEPRPEPAWLLTGEADTVVPTDDAARWRRHLAGPVEAATLPGGHFFPFREGQDAVLAMLSRLLRQAARA